jgi:FAD/FMN-containing dehydrogenase
MKERGLVLTFCWQNWGWACEQVIGIDVVTADAREIHCSTIENADLFWVARGSGPGNGSVIQKVTQNTDV